MVRREEHPTSESEEGFWSNKIETSARRTSEVEEVEFGRV
jgi:hypothetical protein